jgi:outer membrane murein-binding lipoprotein Lpp
MRGLIIGASCLIAAGCSDGGQVNQAAEAADALQAGQWQISSEVSDFRSTDKATPALKAAAGDKAEAPACIEAGKEDKPPAEMFAGVGYKCDYKDRYISGGRINLSLECDREALEGKVMVSVQGTYKADSFEGTATATSFLPGDGDFVMNSKISGRRTAPSCAAPPAEGSKGKAKA